MIHTMDISCRLSEYQFQTILDEQGATQDSLPYETTAYAPSGISALRLYRVDRADFQSQYLQISMNPQFVITGASDPMGLFDPLDFAELVPAFREVLETITNVRTPPLPEWYATRIDYATDTQVNNSATRPTAQQYVELARQGLLPLRAEETGLPEWISYAAANNSSVVSVYSRGPALRARFLGLDEEIYRTADDVLRLEVRCQKGRLSNIRQRYSFPNRQLQHFMTHPAIGQLELARQARRVFGRWDYISYRRAARYIEGVPSLQKRIRTALKHFMKAIEIAKGITNAQAVWHQDTPMPIVIRFAAGKIKVQVTPVQFVRYIRRLHKLHLNPVPIPASWDIGVIEHPCPGLIAPQVQPPLQVAAPSVP